MRYGKARYGTGSNYPNWIELPLINGISEMNPQLNDNYLYNARGHSTTNSNCAPLASPRRLSTKCPTSAFLIPAPQSHKSRKLSRVRFSTLFSCAIRRAALAWYCAIKNVHFRWYYTCAVSRQVYRHGVGLFTSIYIDREISDFGR
jgi:hypothetical protein